MTLTVTPGSSVADSYVSVAECVAYALSRGLEFPDPADAADEDAALLLAEQALRRATFWLDGEYRSQFQGMRVNYRAQMLEWPRYGVVDMSGVYVDHTIVPVEVRQATCEAAIRELSSVGSLSPDMDRGNAIKSIKAGSVGIVYDNTASTDTLYPIIDNILGSLIIGIHETRYSTQVTR